MQSSSESVIAGASTTLRLTRPVRACAQPTARSVLCCLSAPLPIHQRLRRLLAIVLPNMRCKEFFILFLHTMFLVSRTLVSIYVAKLDGSIVKSIVDRKLKLFIWLMCKWMMIAVRIQTRWWSCAGCGTSSELQC